jgi:PAS domain S-box-containing protein
MSDIAVRVLLVDDDEDDYIITRDLISKIGNPPYRLDWVDNYEAGLTRLRQREHDLCLLDYRLGERTGLELLRETQSMSGRPPIILLTGQGDHEIDLEAAKAGAADYLIKGKLDVDRLERAMRYAIEGQRAKERLRRDRDLISRIMETSPVGIIVTDQTGKITFANRRAEEVLGLTRDVIAQRTGSVLDWRSTDLEGNPLPEQPSLLKQVLANGQIAQDIRYTIDRRDGGHTLLSANATPLFDAAGKIDGMVVTVEDITERLTLEAQLRQSQKMESVGQLAAGVAHDINNILTVIQGHAGLLLNITAPDSNSVRSLKQISAASERAATFVRQLLTFSRKQIFRSKILDLNAVLQNLHNMLPQMLGEDIALETRFQPKLPRIEADTGMIEQIVMNLAVNARDAMPKGGKLILATATVEIGTAQVRQHPEARPGWFVCLAVTDSGCGMDHKVMQRLFEPFFTTKEVGKGTGLGLATIYGMVKQHQGWIEVQSELGVGSTFKVFLPVASETRNAPAAPLSEPKPAQGGEETILVVEDETGLLELVRNVLQGYRYRVLAASSGTEALRVWEEHRGRIDLLLTDVIMPGGMTGNDVATQLRKQKPGLKVIYTSGYTSELTGEDSKAKNTVFLAKPYLPLQLAHAVRKCLDGAADSKDEPSPAPAGTVAGPSSKALSAQPA